MCLVRMCYRIHSVLGELSYTKGNVHKNSMSIQARQRKFNGYNNYVLHITLLHDTIGNNYIA